MVSSRGEVPGSQVGLRIQALDRHFEVAMPRQTTDETQDHKPPIRVRIVPSPVMGEVDASIIIPGMPSPPRSRQPALLKPLPKAPPAPQSGLMSLEGFRDNPDLASCLLFWPPYKHRRLPNALAVGLPTEPYRPDSVHRWPSPWQMTCAGVFSPYSLSPTFVLAPDAHPSQPLAAMQASPRPRCPPQPAPGSHASQHTCGRVRTTCLCVSQLRPEDMT